MQHIQAAKLRNENTRWRLCHKIPNIPVNTNNGDKDFMGESPSITLIPKFNRLSNCIIYNMVSVFVEVPSSI